MSASAAIADPLLQPVATCGKKPLRRELLERGGSSEA
jgi:hypothetical protein